MQLALAELEVAPMLVTALCPMTCSYASLHQVGKLKKSHITCSQEVQC